MLFSRANLMVVQVASEHASDLGINAVRLNSDGSTTATDGKVMMSVGPMDATRVHFPEMPQGSPGEKGLSVPLELIEDTIKNLPKDKRVSLQIAAMSPIDHSGEVEMVTVDMHGKKKVSRRPKREPFPPWKEHLRKLRGTVGTKVCVNRKSLIHLLQALEEACPDKGNENPIYIEINSEGAGLVLRCVNVETGQHATGGITRYNTREWLPMDMWEREVFAVVKKTPIVSLSGE